VQQIIDDLNWRYATKRFDAEKKLSDEQLSFLKESIRLSASSYGMQAYKVLIVENPETRLKLMEASFGQRPIVDASHLFVFCAYTKVLEKDVQKYMDLIKLTRGTHLDDLVPFQKGILSSVNKLTDSSLVEWTSKQTYIALGQLLHTCASMRIDALPMEGFKAKEFNKILDIDAQHLTATLACPVGYRHDQDTAQFRKKVRKPIQDLFEVR